METHQQGVIQKKTEDENKHREEAEKKMWMEEEKTKKEKVDMTLNQSLRL
jgi:hypothetical protein